MGLGSFFGLGGSNKPESNDDNNNNNNFVLPDVTAPNSNSSQIKEQLKGKIQQELAVANAAALIRNVSETCFDRCLKSPYTSSNDTCIDQCLAKYLRSWNIISRAYVTRIQNSSRSGEI